MEIVNNENTFTHLVTKKMKLFEYLKAELIVSLRLTNELIKSERLQVNFKTVKKNINLNVNDCITIQFADEINNYVPQDLPLHILYESVDLLIINKQPNILVHPTSNHLDHTIANAVAFYYNTIHLRRKIRFVNRLDMDTSGILIIAKNAYSHQFIAKQFDEETIIKKYLTIIEGKLIEKSGIITDEINGKRSKTIYQVVKEYDQYTLVECILKSGRTHQIRIHLSSLGGYILGDSYYHKESNLIKRQALHAYELTFAEPRTNELKTIICDLPDDMKKIL